MGTGTGPSPPETPDAAAQGPIGGKALLAAPPGPDPDPSEPAVVAAAAAIAPLPWNLNWVRWEGR